MRLQNEFLEILMFKTYPNICILLSAITILVFVAFSTENFVFPPLPDNFPIALENALLLPSHIFDHYDRPKEANLTQTIR